MRNLLLTALAVGLCLTAQGVEAHAFLLKSDPAVGAKIHAPMAVRLEFSEAVELGFSGVEVTNGSGKPVGVSHLRYDGGERKTMLVDLPALPAGQYRVKWHVVSVDTHRTEGDFSFTVMP